MNPRNLPQGKISIRKPRREEIPFWIEMRHKLWPRSRKEDHLFEVQELFLEDRFFNLMAFAEGPEGDTPMAFLEATVRPFANGCTERPVLFLEGIWVEENFRRKGVAKALIGELEKWAQKNGFREIGSDTEISNQESIAAHKAWGFAETEKVVYFKKSLFPDPKSPTEHLP